MPDQVKKRMDLRDLREFEVWERDNPPAEWWLEQIAGWVGIKLMRPMTVEEEADRWKEYLAKLNGG